LFVDENTACEDQGLRSLARGCVALIYEQLVETNFFSSRFSLRFNRVNRHSVYQLSFMRLP
jgi:hypothetical protein